jgi:hypothetical protein
MLRRIKKALRDRLGVTALEAENARLNRQIQSVWKTNTRQNERIKTTTGYFDNRIAGLERIGAQAKATLSKAEQLTDTGKRLMQHFEIGIDVGVHDESWAVLCVHGSKELLYFIDMRDSNMQEVRDMLTRYAGTRQTVDAPYGMVKNIKPYKAI